MDSTHLVHMANQIAANLAAQGEAKAIAATAQHIRDYWAPSMIAAVTGLPDAPLSPIAAAALSQVAAVRAAP